MVKDTTIQTKSPQVSGLASREQGYLSSILDLQNDTGQPWTTSRPSLVNKHTSSKAIIVRKSTNISHQEVVEVTRGFRFRFPVLPAENKAICPVFWTYRMIQDNPGQPQDPLLLINTPAAKLLLSANQLIYRIRKWLKLLGEPDQEYSLHSLGRGGATFAYQSNLEGEMIKLLGGWASDCYKRYIDISIDKRYDSMKAFVEALNNLTAE